MRSGRPGSPVTFALMSEPVDVTDWMTRSLRWPGGDDQPVAGLADERGRLYRRIAGLMSVG